MYMHWLAYTCVCSSPIVLKENFLSSAIIVSISCRRPFRSHGDLFCFPPPPPPAAVPFTLPPAPLAVDPLVEVVLLLAAVDLDEVAVFLLAMHMYEITTLRVN